MWGATWAIFKWYEIPTFQSTRPVWGATIQRGAQQHDIQFQSTRPVWGATRVPHRLTPAHKFQSTRPVWGATIGIAVGQDERVISIHAPRVGRDYTGRIRSCRLSNFNPRAPCGARPPPTNWIASPFLFQSTRPVWGATPLRRTCTNCSAISIHAPRVGRDSLHSLRIPLHVHFNPRAPCGARQFVLI